jgi:hypothetical protein
MRRTMASQEIIDFMLGTSKGQSSPLPTTPRSATLSSNNTSSEWLQSSSPKTTSSSGTIVQIRKAFCHTLTQDWLETDDTAHQVMHSVANLRERLWHTSQLLLLETTKACNKEPNGNTAGILWKQCGYRGGSGGCASSSELCFLTVDDLQMALDHDLQQHERMLVNLRRLLSATGLAQEALGRRLDEWYRLSLLLSEEQQQQPQGLSLDDCHNLFTATANELYRKQMLAAQVLESSASDDLLVRADDDEQNRHADDDDSSPRRIAHQCCAQWPRTHKESHLLEYEALLKEMQQKTK